ncbi:MAG: glycosyl transferase, family 9 [Thermoleophilia bacterium]|nr:glycosyl transferase, family 9 [Thermoleophilia bacterium]
MDPAHNWLPETGLGPDPAAVREVLVIRPGGLAAVVHAVPALRHLRATYPAARITVAADAPALELLSACPYVDRTVELARPSEALLESFDVAVSFAAPSAAEPTLCVDTVDAGFRASWSHGGAVERGAIHPDWPVRLPEATRMLRLAWLLGGSEPDATLGLWPTLADRNGAARVIEGCSRPIALVHVGAGRPSRRWPADRWARVLELLEGAGLDPVLVGGEGDVVAGQAVISAGSARPLDVTGETTVGQLVGLLERAALFVGGDSGPAALAGAVGTRCVVVGPGSTLELQARPGQTDLVHAGPCRVCGEMACQHESQPADAVALEPVLARVALAAATALDRWNATQP